MRARYINHVFLIMSVTLKGNIVTDLVFYINVYKKAGSRKSCGVMHIGIYGLYFAIGPI